jgi:PPOX class probable FMN-dependent enzyme
MAKNRLLFGSITPVHREENMAQITTMEMLRTLIPAPSPRAGAKLRPLLCDQGMSFIRRSPFLVMGTIGAWGLELSQKGDDPGFVEIIDARTLLISERRGNQLLLGLGNILTEPRVGLAFFVPATDEVLRVSGRATLHDDANLCARLSARGEPAVLVIKVEIDRAAFHCVRSARRARLWQPESWSAPGKISFGQIYAEALGQPEIRDIFEQTTETHNAKL